MSSLLLVICLHIAVTAAIITKQTLLSPKTAAYNDSVVTLNPDSTAVIPYIYYIVRVSSQDSYDIKLSLDNSYAFDPALLSTFSLTINGFTPFIHQNTDILFVFSVGDLQYFSFLLHLNEYNKILNKIYFPTANHMENVSEWISDPNKINSNEWIALNQHQSLWPLKFVITNNPQSGKSVFEFYHNISCTLSVRYEFDKSFDANKDINIYIMGQAIKQQFYISSFDILLTTNNASSTYETTASYSLSSNNTSLISSAITNPATNQSTNVSLSETILSEQSETPHTDKLFNSTSKSQAITFIAVILFTVAILWLILLVLRRFCEPIEENANKEKSDEIVNDENDSECDPDLEHEHIENNNEYMNEGVLGTGYIVKVKHDPIIPNVECRENKDDSVLICGYNNNLQRNIEMINDNEDKEVIVRKISDEINYCVSFNYCDEMLS